MKRIWLAVLLVGLIITFVASVAQGNDKVLVLYGPGGKYLVFSFPDNDDPIEVNYELSGDAWIKIQTETPSYEDWFEAAGDTLSGSHIAGCDSLIREVKAHNATIYAITVVNDDGSETRVEIGFQGSDASILEEVDIEALSKDCHVYILMEVAGKYIQLEIVDGQIVPPPAPPSPPVRPTLKQMKQCAIMMMQARYGFSSQFAKSIEGEFSILTINRAMRDGGDNADEFLVALYGYSLQELRIGNSSQFIVFTFYIGNNFTKTFMPKDGFMKVNPNITVTRVTEEGKVVLVDDLVGFDSNPDVFLRSEFNEETRKFRIVWDVSALKPGYYKLYLGNFYQDWPAFHMFFGELAPNGKIPFEINTFPVPVNQ